MTAPKHTALSIRDLSVSFKTDEGRVRAVQNLSLDLLPGETLGLVGESGCGKSVSAMSVLRLVPSPPGNIDSGSIVFEERDILALPYNELRNVRGAGIGMIFQEPMTALSPLHRVGRQLMEALSFHTDISRAQQRDTAREWLEKVGIPDPTACMDAYPYQLSGGMRQRVMIAMALMLEPRVLIADEPTTALDVTIQAQVLELMRAMKTHDTSILLITHDMGVIWEMCDRVAVMYASELVELGSVTQVFEAPQHPYTRALLDSVPPLTERRERLNTIPGSVPSPLAYPAGCHFRDRCAEAGPVCESDHPELQRDGQRAVRCHMRTL